MATPPPALCALWRIALPVRATVYALTTHRTGTGGHTVRFLAVVGGEIHDASGPIATLTGFRFDRERGGLKLRSGTSTLDVVQALGDVLHNDRHALNHHTL